MTYTPFLAAEGGIVDSLVDSASKTGEIFGFNAWLYFSQIISFVIVAFLLQKFAYGPVMAVLEARRQKIKESLENAEKIKQQLAESETRYQEILAKANAEGQKMIDDARAAAKQVQEREAQRAIAEAEQIVAKAREATIADREREFAALKREISRLVVDTTAKVTGKTLTNEDQRRISEEASKQLAA